MNKLSKPLVFLLAPACMLSATSICAMATDYLFHVGCPNRILVAEWKTGSIDPGKEYLRVQTGMKYSGCSISDYNGSRDAHLPRESYSHEGGVIAGIPLVGPLLSQFGKWLGW